MERATGSGFSETVASLLRVSFFAGELVDVDRQIHAAFIHHFQNPGGGARGNLTYRCASLLGLGDANGGCLAAAVECLHNASLVQDDLQDQSPLRRGRESVVAKFGADVALGLADRLITAAFVCLSEARPSKALPAMILRIHHAVSETLDGQTSELSGNSDGASLDSRLVAASQKSGPLFALALELPLILAREQDSLEAAHRAACQFGLGYQILDDLTDQVDDAESASNGNLVLAMDKDSPGNSAQSKAARLARRLLQDAVTGAGGLPRGAGGPLIELAERLLPQLDVFDS